MHSIIIKEAKEADVKLIKNLSWQTFFDTFREQNTREDMELFLSENFNTDKVLSEFKDPKNTFVIAYLKNEPIGYAKLSESNNAGKIGDENAIEISRLYAVKEKIGSGVGKALMDSCISIGNKKNKRVIWLGVWEHNQRAINFYRRFGFEKFGETVFMLGKDKQNDWLMKKDLTQTLPLQF
jgi:diamine N-acetyltransferase